MDKGRETFYTLAADNWNSEEFEAIQEVIDSNHFTMGEQVKLFETNVAKKLAELKGVGIAKVAEITTENSRKIFSK